VVVLALDMINPLSMNQTSNHLEIVTLCNSISRDSLTHLNVSISGGLLPEKQSVKLAASVAVNQTCRVEITIHSVQRYPCLE
jgi:hypothetical protein